jgi:hypothetical protein
MFEGEGSLGRILVGLRAAERDELDTKLRGADETI